MKTRGQSPPASARRFLEWFCREELLEELRGDLDEAFAAAIKVQSPRTARLHYWKEVLFLLRAHTIRARQAPTTQGPIMLKNYINIAFRSMRRQKGFSAINLVGLAIGLAATFLIGMYVQDELSFDAYHPDADRIYRLVSAHADDDYDGIAKINGPWGVTAAEEISDIEAVTRFVHFGSEVLEYNDSRIQIGGGFYTDSTMFDVFSWSLLEGDPATALVAPHSLVVTTTFAETVFGDEEALGQTVRIAGQTDYTVTGVMDDIPRNSHFRPRFLVSMSGYAHESHDDWVRWNQYYTYLKLRPGGDPSQVGALATAILPAHMEAQQAQAASPLLLQPLADIYLNTTMFREIAGVGDRDSVMLFAALAVFILLLAAVNFINLATARATNRAQEVGVRKSLGAQRGAVIRQFLVESVLTVALAALLASVLMMAALGQFNTLAGKAFSLGELFSLDRLAMGLMVVVGIGLAAGAYPALILSRFRPAAIVGGSAGGRGGLVLRRGLVAVQFVVSATLIMASGVVSDQLTYVENLPLGFEKEALVNVFIQDNSLVPRFEQLKADLAAVPGVESVALSGNRPGGGDWGIPMEIPGMRREEQPAIRLLVVDGDFPSTYGLTIVEGRDFDEDRITDAENGLLINEEMVRQLGWDEPIGKRILSPPIEREFEVIGVVQDFHFRSVHEAIAPVVLFSAPMNWYSMASVRLSGQRIPEALEGLEAVYKRYDELNPFSFSFVDEQFSRLYSADRQIGELLRIATGMALLVACLGLFGLAAHAAQRRTKEIGVRKAIGATSPGIVALLTKETAILVGLSLIVSAPLAVLVSQNWLDQFAYHVAVRPVTLIIGAVIAVFVALATSGFQAWRAARMNPVSALRMD